MIVDVGNDSDYSGRFISCLQYLMLDTLVYNVNFLFIIACCD